MFKPLAFIVMSALPSTALAQEPSYSEQTAELAPQRPEARPEVDESHLRGGVTAGAGFFAPGPSTMFGLSGRLGAQITRSFGIDAEFAFAAGFGLGLRTSAGQAVASVSGAAYYQLAVLADLLIAEHLFLDLGPAVAQGIYAGTIGVTDGNGNSSATGYVVAGWLPGVAGKIGYMAGSRNPRTGSRHGFVISLDVNALFGDRLSATMSTMNGGSTRTNFGPGLGIGAMLNLGYAWR